MQIAVLGTGYVGLSTGVCLAEIGHNVYCIDIDERKIELLRQGISPIYEPGLDELLQKNIQNGRLFFTTSYEEGIKNREVIIIAVGTPQSEDGSADLSYIKKAVCDLSSYLKDDVIIAVKSTVPVGTNDELYQLLKDRCNKNIRVDLVSNPEFLRQGSAIHDTLHADRIVIGAKSEEAAAKMKEMYLPLQVPIIQTDIRSAEMIKYASNAFLAMKISYINEIANLCEVLGANVNDVAKGMGMDKRIGGAFLHAGIGYGGSCFPKDVKALLHTAKSHHVDFAILKETVAVNERQRRLLVKKAVSRFGDLRGKKFALFGLAFKPNTDDMREAPSIIISKLLTELGAKVTAYDPVATENAKKILGDSISYAQSAYEAARDANALFVVTEWPEFQQLDVKALLDVMKQPIIFDGRNIFDLETLNSSLKAYQGFEYYPVGKRAFIVEKK
ncbi:UDP-glucose dehydrogenase family protein [Calidifontibacillus erzurumensis]|uniref:UDP-glucose 6-dehydrogenase n=1 Tax=Calidifontibacillus erzurumensis TaxID=2741433 RepID=A0A8J8GG27_9BACI|nr:UDP-glucose/GDP-mannose dehydrogenase family protein [Calidifontibacillus erzurumensis]NSL52829.1 UDP-glucose/GDP-mannose dehydrogenase family protein [Calidifontibacillus erzurumensis]